MAFIMDTAAAKRGGVSACWMAAVCVLLVAMPDVAFAQGVEADGRLTRFLANLRALLNIASAVIVSSAVIFTGYQLAFAHKRMVDVAPILVGGLLIGAAAQLADIAIGIGGDIPAAATVACEACRAPA